MNCTDTIVLSDAEGLPFNTYIAAQAKAGYAAGVFPVTSVYSYDDCFGESFFTGGGNFPCS